MTYVNGRCASSTCIEVLELNGVLMLVSNQPDNDGVLIPTAEELVQFLTAVKAGELDDVLKNAQDVAAFHKAIDEALDTIRK